MSTQAPTKERGWPAHPHEVRAILDGRQSQFRRPMKPQPERGARCPTCIVCGMDKPPRGRSVPMVTASGYCCSHDCKGYWKEPLTGDLWPGESRGDFGYPHGWEGVSPFGKPGDRLWVRETWAQIEWTSLMDGRPREPETVYRAGPHPFDKDQPHGWHKDNKWKPSIHMPRWASRIDLEVTGVRVERVQEISPEDAKAEGIKVPRCGCEVCSTSGGICTADASEYLMAFRDLWDFINAKRGFGWDKNPWTWKVSFKRVTP